MAAVSLINMMLLNSVTSTPLKSGSATICVGFPPVAFCAKERAILLLRGGGTQGVSPYKWKRWY